MTMPAAHASFSSVLITAVELALRFLMTVQAEVVGPVFQFELVAETVALMTGVALLFREWLMDVFFG